MTCWTSCNRKTGQAFRRARWPGDVGLGDRTKLRLKVFLMRYLSSNGADRGRLVHVKAAAGQGSERRAIALEKLEDLAWCEHEEILQGSGCHCEDGLPGPIRNGLASDRSAQKARRSRLQGRYPTAKVVTQAPLPLH